MPEVLAGGASVDHVDGDFSRDMTSIGVWIPSGFTPADFHVHDSSAAARMVYVGSGPNQWCSDWGPPSPDCHFESTPDWVWVLTEHPNLEALLAQLAPLHDAGLVEYAHFTEVVDLWRTEHGSVPNIVQYDQIDPADYTCNR